MTAIARTWSFSTAHRSPSGPTACSPSTNMSTTPRRPAKWPSPCRAGPCASSAASSARNRKREDHDAFGDHGNPGWHPHGRRRPQRCHDGQLPLRRILLDHQPGRDANDHAARLADQCNARCTTDAAGGHPAGGACHQHRHRSSSRSGRQRPVRVLGRGRGKVGVAVARKPTPTTRREIPPAGRRRREADRTVPMRPIAFARPAPSARRSPRVASPK